MYRNRQTRPELARVSSAFFAEKREFADRSLQTLVMLCTVLSFSHLLPIPVLNTYLQECFNTPRWQVGILVLVKELIGMISTYFGKTSGPTIGYDRVLLLYFVTSVFGFVGCGLARNYWQFSIAFYVTAIGSSPSVCINHVQVIGSPDQIANFTQQFEMQFVVAYILSSALAGVFYQFVDPLSIWSICAAISIVFGLYAYRSFYGNFVEYLQLYDGVEDDSPPTSANSFNIVPDEHSTSMMYAATIILIGVLFLGSGASDVYLIFWMSETGSMFGFGPAWSAFQIAMAAFFGTASVILTMSLCLPRLNKMITVFLGLFLRMWVWILFWWFPSNQITWVVTFGVGATRGWTNPLLLALLFEYAPPQYVTIIGTMLTTSSTLGKATMPMVFVLTGMGMGPFFMCIYVLAQALVLIGAILAFAGQYGVHANGTQPTGIER